MQLNSNPAISPSNKAIPILKNLLLPRAIILFQIIAGIILISAIFFAFDWVRTPFIGFFVDPNLLLNSTNSVKDGSWGVTENGFSLGDQLTALDGETIDDIRQYTSILNTLRVGDHVEVTVTTPEGELKSRILSMSRFPMIDLILQMAIPWIIGCIYFGSGIWVFRLRFQDNSGKIFAVFASSAAISIATLFESHTTYRLSVFWFVSIPLSAATLIHMAFVFPEKSSRFRRWMALLKLSYGIAAIFILVAVPLLYDSNQPKAYTNILRLSYAFLILGAAFYVAGTALQKFRANISLAKQQGRIILLGAFFSFAPLVVWFLVSVIHPGIYFNPLLLVPLALFPLSIAYAILRYRVLNTDYLLSRLFMYGLLTVIAVAGYALVVSGLSLMFTTTLKPSNPIFIGLMVFILAIFLNPLRENLQDIINRAFFRRQLANQEHIRLFTQELSPVFDLREIGNLLRQYVEKTIAPSQQHIFLPDSVGDFFVSLSDETGEPTTDLRFAKTSDLPRMLSRDNTYIFIGGGLELPAALESEKARIQLLASQVFIPLVGRGKRLIGFMALSGRRSGEPYTNVDLDFLTSLSEQAAITIERAQVVSDLEQRVNEMNVLMRVAEGINVTPRFDDILELIYAQTNRLIPLRDFWILLFDGHRNEYRYAFYLENDIRSLERENRPVELGVGLAQEVVRLHRAIVTDDYQRECRQRGFQPLIDGLYAWAGVPLNAGDETIGALSLGIRDVSVSISNDQLGMLQAIADQAAGAIVKTRLLHETERRARQLGLINEIGRTLTSTLDLPSLLNQVMDNAVEIINCEAGTLFLVDENTGELIFEVVTGPVADELIGQRLAAGTGHVGQAVETGQPAIVNKVYRTAEWARSPDEVTGFQTRDLLIAPMVVKGNVIGVIEVINRRDGAPFTEDDQNLLTAFASQAGIALENARLYTLTDQQLAARVDELSVMQRIDRELNASLDIQRAMRITLNWAMNQSGADAGIVGSIEDGFVQIMADQGYRDELLEYGSGQLPVERFPALRRAVSEVDTQIIHRSQLDQSYSGLLDGMNSQLVYPIRREDRVIGVMLLESRSESPWAADTQEFLSRLSDHAAIAIANSQLFSQVQAADIAKNDFISFVAHELKTPMTSIRGYTDLLMGGAVGEINEGQENFLQTIRSNVNRMATLVSDLADISRIEAGRLRLDFEAVNIESVIDEAMRAQGHSISEKNQMIKTDIPKNIPRVWGDHVRIVQILVNFISNAHKYSPEGGTITVSAEHSANHWDPKGAADVVKISIEDDGIGMSEEDQAQIFSKFFRSENPKAREAPGSGLGLNITKNLVEMQGGTIWFESALGEGTTFFFTIPVAQL